MKFFVALLALTSIALVTGAELTAEQKEKLVATHKQCLADTALDNEVVSQARKGEFSDDPKLKEYLFCVAKKIGFLNEAGDIQEEVLRQKVGAALNDEALAQKLIGECAVKKATPQDTAFDTVKCYYEKTPTHISIV